ncbi:MULTISPECIES: hypothetical protein [unclassified Methylobacterium]|nr:MULTISPECIES: hypothetical protein [Methylobacterium]WFT79087.1 hypothetical protein QA634_28240 [Methylobacterium nodulans]
MSRLDERAAASILPLPSIGKALIGFAASTTGLILAMLMLGGIA